MLLIVLTALVVTAGVLILVLDLTVMVATTGGRAMPFRTIASVSLDVIALVLLFNAHTAGLSSGAVAALTMAGAICVLAATAAGCTAVGPVHVRTGAAGRGGPPAAAGTQNPYQEGRSA